MKIQHERDKLRAINQIKELDLSEKAYRFSLKVYREIRSLKQNKLYWLYLTIIAYETGNDKDYLHDYFREQHLGFEQYNVSYPYDTTKSRLKSTKGLNTKQFTVYLDKIHLEMAEKMPEIKLPDPNEKEFDRILEYYSDVLEET